MNSKAFKERAIRHGETDRKTDECDVRALSPEERRELFARLGQSANKAVRESLIASVYLTTREATGRFILR